MKNEIIKFSPTNAVIASLAEKYKNLEITDGKSYAAVVSGIGEIRTLRVSVEARRKELKADALSWGRKVDAEAKKITALLWPIEDNLKNLKQATDDEKALAKAEKERVEKERIESIQSKIATFPPDMSRLPQLLKMSALEIREMQDALAAIEINIEDYQEFIPEAIKTKEEKRKLLQEYYIARITADAEATEQKAEAKRQEQIRKDQEAKQKIEDDRLAKIREDQEIEAQKLRDAQAKIDAQKKAIQDEKDQLESERLDRERIEQERLAQIEKDRLAKIEAEEQEKARIEKEAEEKAAREKANAEKEAKQEALRPDKKALELYQGALAAGINRLDVPLMKTPDGKIALSFIQTNIEKVFADILEIIEEM